MLFDLQGELFFGAAPELERTFAEIRSTAQHRKVRHVLLRLKRVRNPGRVSLEQFERFLQEARRDGLRIWLAGVQPDLLGAFQRLQGDAEDFATLAAIRCIRSELSATATPREDRFYYLM